MLIRGDARQLPLRDSCVDCVVTSSPYFGLRDYGNPQQIGLEPTPEAYVSALVAVFREVKRVLKPDGTAWVNMGDSYATGTTANRNPTSLVGSEVPASWSNRSQKERCGTPAGWKTKDLLGMPWRVAFALQADGWYLRSDIIWSKPNPMPESVTDRPTKAHEYLFLLSKSERYFYDADAIREDQVAQAGPRRDDGRTDGYVDLGMWSGRAGNPEDGRRNRRSVWTVSTMPYSGAHFATMPEKLVEPCILAGCPLGGLVLDPFVGSGTVVAVSQRLGRRGVGVDLGYQDLAKARTAQRGLRFTEAQA